MFKNDFTSYDPHHIYDAVPKFDKNDSKESISNKIKYFEMFYDQSPSNSTKLFRKSNKKGYNLMQRYSLHSKVLPNCSIL